MQIRQASPGDGAVETLLDEYFAERASTWAGDGAGYQRRPANFDEGVILLVEDGGECVGIGGLRHVPSDDGVWWEAKHMYVRPAARGRGLARALLAELEAVAIRRGATDLVLDTHHNQTAAVALYRSAGFEDAPPFNDNPNATVWMRKPLT